MGKVNISEVLEKAEKQKKADEPIIQQVTDVSGKVWFRIKGTEDAYESLGEALQVVSEKNRQAEFKKAGLDSTGRTPEQVERSEKITALIKKRTELMDKVKDIDVQIGLVKSGLDLDSLGSKKKK